MTVSQAAAAITQVPISRRRVRVTMPFSLSSSDRRLQNSAIPPANAKRNRAPNPMPWTTAHHSLYVRCMAPPLPEELDVFCPQCRFNFLTMEGNFPCADPLTCEHSVEPTSHVGNMRRWREGQTPVSTTD